MQFYLFRIAGAWAAVKKLVGSDYGINSTPEKAIASIGYKYNINGEKIQAMDAPSECIIVNDHSDEFGPRFFADLPGEVPEEAPTINEAVTKLMAKIAAVLVILFALCVPAEAANDYKIIYRQPTQMTRWSPTNRSTHIRTQIYSTPYAIIITNSYRSNNAPLRSKGQSPRR